MTCAHCNKPLLNDAGRELLAKALTEAACRQFGDWLSVSPGNPVPFNLKADVYNKIHQILKDGIEV